MRRADSPNLRDGLDRHHNSLNFLRLVFAAAVIVDHTWVIGGYGRELHVGSYSLGRIAVAGFFAISGYLIAASRMHHSGPRFLVRRILRIYPAYVVCLIVTALAFAPLAAMIGPGHLDLTAAGDYIRGNLFLKINTYNIAHTLDAVPYSRVWNGSLWTLRYEFFCYLVVGVLLSFLRFRTPLMVLLFVGSFATAAGTSLSDTTGVVYELSCLLSVFAAGSLLAIWADRIPLDSLLAAASAVVLAGSVPLHLLHSLGALPLCYLILWLGRVLPFAKVGRRNDISYGVYIYGMPIQQTLVLLHADRLPALVFAALAIALTVPLAAASWFAIERPALRLVPRVDARLARLPRLRTTASRSAGTTTGGYAQPSDPDGGRAVVRVSSAGLIVLAGAVMSLYPAFTLARETYYRLR